MKNSSIAFVLLLSSNVFSQSVYVPDDNFEQVLIDLELDDVLDDSVLVDNVNAIVSLSVNFVDIYSLEGIQAFSALEYLDCSYNHLTSIDVSENLQLKLFVCDNNELTELDVSSNLVLERLFCGNNPISVIDINGCTALYELNSIYSELTSIDLSANTLLRYIYVPYNSITSLDVSNLPLLENLNFDSNGITNIDLSNNSALESLNCVDNELSELDVSNCLVLDHLVCSNNPFTVLELAYNSELQFLVNESSKITQLDLHYNMNLSTVKLQNGLLQKLSINNGHNTAIDESNFDLRNNPELTCITVDGPTYSEETWTLIDGIISFSEDCESAGVTEQSLFEYSIYPNPTKEILNIDLNSEDFELNLYSVSGKVVYSANLLKGTNNIYFNDIASGVYIAELKSKDVIYKERIIIR